MQERRSVAWDLMKYGEEVLEKVSQPSYTFDVDSANFLVVDEFEAFKNALTLGKRIYLKLGDKQVLKPVLIGLECGIGTNDGLKLEFSSKYSTSDQSFQLVDLLEQSVSMGTKLDLSRNSYGAFVDSHANVAFKEFYNGALDVAKNMVMSSTGQAVTWDENGIRLRKWNAAHTGYEDQQIWMTNGTICFTDDGWETAKMAIGHIVDSAFAGEGNETGDLWGVIAENLVGKMIAGETLHIYGADAQGRNATFTIDGTGVHSTNMSQIWDGDNGQVAVAPDYGIIAGVKGPNGKGLFEIVDGKIVPAGTLDVADGKPTNDNINVWIGTDGTAYFKGTVYADKGRFTGDVEASDFKLKSGETFTSILNNAKTQIMGDYLDLFGVNVYKDRRKTQLAMTIDGDGIQIYDGTLHAPEIYSGTFKGSEFIANGADSSFRLVYTQGGTAGELYIGSDNWLHIVSPAGVKFDQTGIDAGVWIGDGQVLTTKSKLHYTLA